MASAIKVTITKLVSACTDLRAELSALITEQDQGRLSTVMGPGDKYDVARMKPNDLRNHIKTDVDLTEALKDVVNAPDVLKAVYVMMELYADRTLRSTLQLCEAEVSKNFVQPAASRAGLGSRLLDAVETVAKELQNAALRIPGTGSNETQAELIKTRYLVK